MQGSNFLLGKVAFLHAVLVAGRGGTECFRGPGQVVLLHLPHHAQEHGFGRKTQVPQQKGVILPPPLSSVASCRETLSVGAPPPPGRCCWMVQGMGRLPHCLCLRKPCVCDLWGAPAILFVFLRVNTFLWVKHLLSLYTLSIHFVVIVCFLFHCFLHSGNCYLNLCFYPSLTGSFGVRGVV